MKYFTPMTAEEIDQLWYDGGRYLSGLYHASQVLFIQSKKDGTPRTDGKACVYPLSGLRELKYNFQIVIKKP